MECANAIATASTARYSNDVSGCDRACRHGRSDSCCARPSHDPAASARSRLISVIFELMAIIADHALWIVASLLEIRCRVAVGSAKYVFRHEAVEGGRARAHDHGAPRLDDSLCLAAGHGGHVGQIL